MNFTKPIILLFLFISSLFASETISVDNTTSYKQILNKSEIYIDHTQKLTFDQIKQKAFKGIGQPALHYGYSPEFTVWVRFTLKNSTDQSLLKTLEYANPMTTTVELYEGKSVFKDGLFQLNSNRDSINPIFPITLEPNETKTYYLKATSTVTTLIVNLKLWEPKVYQKESFYHQMILAMFFAALGILAVYNFFIYFFTKDKNYLFYLLYMLGIINHQLWYTGFGNIHLFSQKVTTVGVSFAEFYVGFGIFMFSLLVRSFLNIKQYPRLSRFYDSCLKIFPFLVIGVWYFEIYSIRNFFSFTLLIITTVVLLYSIYKKNRQAYFVGLGWGIFIVSVVFMYLSSSGVLDIFDRFKYFVEIGIVLEAVIFSVALADKIKVLEQRKNEATMTMVLHEQMQKLALEKQVKEKTKELQQAFDEKNLLLKELNHRVKNNMQLIVSLIRLQSDTIEDTKAKELLKTIRTRINAMGAFHEMLYKQENISFIDTREYFESLIDELQNGFEKENIKIKYNIDTDLEIEDALYCGLIVNELVTNSFKYAFRDNSSGTIEICLKKQFGHYLLSVSDNGDGYSDMQKTDALGNTLIDSLVQQQLDGEIKRISEEGVKVVISWEMKTNKKS